MAKVGRTNIGLAFIKINLLELMEVEPGALGICDFCGKVSSTGYYIPVLNRWYCDECFEEWQTRANRFEEDVPYEESNLNSWIDKLKKHNLLEE